MQNRPTYIELDSSALRHNLNRVREMAPDALVMAVIKADGYGHGMEFVAQSLTGADEFAVTSLDDVDRLRSMGIDKTITVLSTQFTAAEAARFTELKLRPVIYDQTQLTELKKLGSAAKLDLWLKIDTGMGRLGFTAEQAGELFDTISALDGVNSVSLMSHLANADQPKAPQNQAQFEQFSVVKKLRDFQQCSLLNSAGIAGNAEQAHNIVRPGVLLYGVSPLEGVSASSLGLLPAMTLKSRLISVKQMAAGSSLGYRGLSVLEKDSMVGIVACGYGDGYPRHAEVGTPVLVNEEIVPMLGRVSMDMIAVDVTGTDARVSDHVTLWGKDNPIEQVAVCADTIAYELMCGVKDRVQRFEF